MVTKELIRKEALRKRGNLTPEERRKKSNVIMEKVMSMPSYEKAEYLLTYISYKSEVGTDALIEYAWKAGKKIYCPKVTGEEMEFYQITSWDDLEVGYMGIREPGNDKKRLLCSENLYKGNHLMIMPGSAFDRERNRIGYGKGYYDKYIEKHAGLETIAVCFDCQLQEYIPTEKYDKRPDILITEKNIYY